MPTTKEFVAKLAEACNAVGGVEKKGRNEMQKYDYVKAADVAKAIRHELFQRGIMILQNEMAPEFIEYQSKSGSRGLDCRIAIEFIITDGESEYRVMAHSQAMDTSDKAIFKAKTGCLKYFLRGLGLIPDEKDDPETESPSAEFNKDEYVKEKTEGLSRELAWLEIIKHYSTAEDFNGGLAEITRLPAEFQQQAKRSLWNKATACGIPYDKSKMAFVDPEENMITQHEKFTQQLEASLLQSPQESPAPRTSSGNTGLQSGGQQGQERISQAQLIKIQKARKDTKISDVDYRNILGRQGGVTSSTDLQKANFQPVLDAILDHSKIGV